MDINVNITGLEGVANAIASLAEALKAGVTANEVIAKAATRSPKKTPPADATVGKSGPTDSATPDTATSTAPAAETPEPAAEPSKPAAPSEPAAKGPPTVSEVRAALGALVKVDKERALAILTKHGAPSVSALKEEDYAAVLAEATK